jgi:hypothetical protein
MRVGISRTPSRVVASSRRLGSGRKGISRACSGTFSLSAITGAHILGVATWAMHLLHSMLA